MSSQFTSRDLQRSLRRLYWLTGGLALFGAVLFTIQRGRHGGLGFLCGAAISWLNLWMFDWISRGITPAAGDPKRRGTGLFIARYLILFGVGYATVNALGFDPIAVVCGLLASTAAVLLSSVFEMAGALSGKPSSS